MGKRGRSRSIERLLQELNEELYVRFGQIKATSVDQLAPRQQQVDDTGAAGFHYVSVHRIVDKLVPAAKLQNYMEIKVFVLLCAIYLHDVGKIYSAGRGEAHHAERGLEAIVSAATELNLSEPEALAIGYVVQAHGPDPISQLPELRGISPFGEVRVPYFGSLLRLADDLDMCFTRAPVPARRLVSPDEEIVGKWDLRRCVDNVTIDPETWTIEVQTTPHTAEEYSSLLREVESINARLAEARPYLQATPDVGLYYKVLDVRTDARWLNRLAPQKRPVNKTAREHVRDLDTVIPALPENAAVVVARQDPISNKEYTQVVAPCLKEVGYVPLLIEDIPASGPLLDRTLSVIGASKLVLANVSESAAPSIHFRLGVAAGLGKELVLYSRAQATIAGDCSGMRVLTYSSTTDLRKKLRKLLNSLST